MIFLKKPSPCVGIRTCSDYSPFGVQLSGRNFVKSGAKEGRFGFNGKEEDDEFKGDGNSYDFGARLLDPRLGRWLTIDPLFRKFSEYSTYNFAINNPIIYIDPDGEDIVYFDMSGKEVKRTKSETQFGARVDLKGDGNYVNAPMPNIIKGYEDPKYQKYDYIIAAETFIFNNTSPSNLPKTDNGLTLDGQQPVQLSPTLVKAVIIQETGMGTIEGNAGQKGSSDIMQANVTTSNGQTDWNENKAKYGLEKNKSATPQQSIHAGIRMLYTNGLVVSKAKYQNGFLSEDSQVDWIGNDRNSWWYAVRNYNGNNKKDKNGAPHKDNYVRNVTKNWANSKFSQDAKYYIPKK